MSDAYLDHGWRVVVQDSPGSFLRNRVTLIVYRNVGDGMAEVDDLSPTGETRKIINPNIVTDEEYRFASIPRDALDALREALDRHLGDHPDRKAEKVLQEALSVERARVDKVLAAMVDPAPRRTRVTNT